MGLDYADGITVTGKSYEADITPVSFDGLGYEGAFVYEPRKGFDEHLFYYTLDQGAEYSNGFYTWNVNTEGRITSVKPFGGTPPLPGKIRGINQLNKLIKINKAPKSIIRFDKGKVFGELDHVHFNNGSALNINGTWKHGSKILNSKEIKFLKDNGWKID